MRASPLWIELKNEKYAGRLLPKDNHSCVTRNHSHWVLTVLFTIIPVSHAIIPIGYLLYYASLKTGYFSPPSTLSLTFLFTGK
jgi:hypothetical protein